MKISKFTEKLHLGRKCEKRSFLELHFIFGSFLLFVMSNEINGFLLDTENLQNKSNENVCFSDICKHEAGSILTNMDSTVDPCNDFYDFACGSYLKYKYIFDDKIRAFGNVADYIVYLKKEQLKKAEPKNGPLFVKDMKTYYESCLYTPTLSVKKIIRKFLNLTQLKGWPTSEDVSTTTLINVVVQSLTDEDTGLLLQISKDPSTSLLNIDKGMTTVHPKALLDEYYKRFLVVKHQYMNLIRYTFMQLGLPRYLAIQYIDEMIQLEAELAKIIFFEKPSNLTNTTIAELQSTCPQINWKTFFKSLFGYLGHSDKYTDNFPLSIINTPYIKDLCYFVENANKRALYNLLVWNMVTPYLARFDQTFRKFFISIYYQMSFYRNNLLRIPFSDKLIWKNCIKELELSYFSYGLDYLMIKSMNPDKDIKEVSSYAKEVSKIMEEIFSSEEWMDDFSKNFTKNKLNSMQYNIGYNNKTVDVENIKQILENVRVTNNYIENILFMKKLMFADSLFNKRIEEFLKYPDPFVVGAWYNYRRDKDGKSSGLINIPLGIMYPPFYAYGRPKYLNFGGIAVVIAHELSHGFHDLSSASESFENMKNVVERDDIESRLGWSQEFIEEYIRRRNCLVDQYFQFPLEGNVTIDGNQTIKDNFADNSGVTLAFRAYEKYLEQHGIEPSLPGLHAFSNRQMFFVGFAQVFCEKIESMKDAFEFDVHSPGKYRILIPLMNSPEFSKAFNCPLKSFMNPEHKCKLWG